LSNKEFPAELMQRCINRQGVLLFSPCDAIKILNYLEKIRQPVIGIDAFFISEHKTQPLMEHSIQYPESDNSSWDRYKTFLSQYLNTSMFFEIVT